MHTWISEITEKDVLWMWRTNSPLARCEIFSYHNQQKVCMMCLAGEPEWQPKLIPLSNVGTMCHESSFV